MQTRSSSKLSRDQTSNPISSTNPTSKGQIRSSKQKVENSHFKDHLTPVATMIDNRTMAEMLRAPTEGCAEAIIVPPILTEQFELKHSLINMMTSEQFFRLKKDNPYDHIRWFNKITSTIKYKDVPNSVIKLILFPFSLARAARRWLEKEPPRSITTWDDLVSKFINEFFPPSRTTNLRNEISNFQQKFDESFHEAWERYKDLLRTCPHHGFTKLHQLDTFYNALNPADQDSLNVAAGGNLLEKSPQDALTIIENKSKGNLGYRPQGVANQMRPPGFAQPNVQNNQNQFGQPQGFNHTNNFNQEQPYQATAQSNQNFHLNELEKIKRTNDVSLKAMQNQIDMVKNELRNEMKTSIQTSLSDQTNEIKNMMASLLQMNTASTSGYGSLPGNTFANPKGKLKAITTRSGLVTDGPTFPLIPNPLIQRRMNVPFLRTARALIDVHGEEMILRDGDERLTLNMKHDTANYSNHPHRESVNLISIFNISNIDSFNDTHPHFDDDPISSSTTYLSISLLKEFTDELALITYPPDYDDNRTCDIESDLREIEFLLYQGEDSDFKDSVDQTDLANRDDLFVDPTLEMFTDEQPPDYSFPRIFDVYPDDFLKIESDADNFDDDFFDFKGEKIKESELLIDELDLPCAILPYSEYDSFSSQDFSKDDDLPSPDNEDKVFNPGILIHEKSVIIVTPVAQEKKLVISYAFLVFEDFDPPFYELLVF
nr:reverse transcriptase domain-containing protein [Tanacetum cinerariifolium]